MRFWEQVFLTVFGQYVSPLDPLIFGDPVTGGLNADPTDPDPDFKHWIMQRNHLAFLVFLGLREVGGGLASPIILKEIFNKFTT